MRHHRIGLIVAYVAAATWYVGCAEDEPLPTDVDAGTLDASVNDGSLTGDGSMVVPADTGVADTGPADTGRVDSGSGSVDAGADAHDAAQAVDAAGLTLGSCAELKAAVPTVGSGVYMIDPDDGGPVTPLPAYCDMEFEGGGWTLIQVYEASASGPSSLSTANDAGPDGGWLASRPVPGTTGAFSHWVVQPLAMRSKQVHIRTPFTEDAGVDSGAYVTSRIEDDGGPSLPMLNLRQLKILNDGNDGGFGAWTGTFANAERMSHPNVTGPNGQTYPNIYWAHTNFSGLHILTGYQTWNYSAANSAFEIYVR